MSWPSLNQLLRVFECTKCDNYLFPPIPQCGSGHSYCHQCFEVLEKCPLCNAPKGKSRCFRLESIHAKIHFPCKNRSEGCPLFLKGLLIKQHEEHCVYKKTRCPLRANNNCTWSGLLKDIVEHSTTVHSSNTYIASEQKLSFPNFTRFGEDDTDGIFHYYILFFCYEEIFICMWELNYTTGFMKWCVFLMGRQEKLKRFSYEICFEYNGLDKISLKAPCQLYEDCTKTLSKCMMRTHYDLLKKYCFPCGELFYTIKIFDEQNNEKKL